MDLAHLARGALSAVQGRSPRPWTGVSQPSLAGQDGGNLAGALRWAIHSRPGRWLARRGVPLLWLRLPVARRAGYAACRGAADYPDDVDPTHGDLPGRALHDRGCDLRAEARSRAADLRRLTRPQGHPRGGEIRGWLDVGCADRNVRPAARRAAQGLCGDWPGSRDRLEADLRRSGLSRRSCAVSGPSRALVLSRDVPFATWSDAGRRGGAADSADRPRREPHHRVRFHQTHHRALCRGGGPRVDEAQLVQPATIAAGGLGRPSIGIGTWHQFISGWRLECLPPTAQLRFRYREGGWPRITGAPLEAVDQLVQGDVEKAKLGLDTEGCRTGPVVLPLGSRPEAPVQHHVPAELRDPNCDLPLDLLDGIALCLTVAGGRVEECHHPVVLAEAQGRTLTLEALGKGRFTGAGQAAKQ